MKATDWSYDLLIKGGYCLLTVLLFIAYQPLSLNSSVYASGLSLSDATEESLDHSPLLQLKQTQRQRTRLQWQQARQTPLEHQYRSAYNIARREVDATEINLKLMVRQAYRSLQMTEKYARTARRAVRVSADRVRLAEDLYESDMITRNDLLESQRDQQKAEHQLTEAVNERSSAALSLRQLMGREPASMRLNVSDRTPSIEAPGDTNVEEKVQQALDNRFEMKQVNEMVSLKKRQWELAKDPPTENWFEEFFPEGEQDHTEESAKLEYREAELVKQLQEEEIVNQVHSRYLDVKQSWNEVKTARDSLKAAEEAWRVEMLRYRLDKTTRLEVLSMQLDKLLCEVDYSSAVYQYDLAQAYLKHSYSHGSMDFESGASREGEGSDNRRSFFEIR